MIAGYLAIVIMLVVRLLSRGGDRRPAYTMTRARRRRLMRDRYDLNPALDPRTRCR